MSDAGRVLTASPAAFKVGRASRYRDGMNDGEPAWTEIRNDAREGATIWDWHCPYAGHEAEVIRSEPGGWRDGYPVLRILEARPAAPSSLPL